MDKALWKRLQNLRQSYLQADGYLADYWQDEALLDAYDKSLGQRIQWKWDAVLQAIPPLAPKRILDWGCGCGGAARSVLRHWPCEEVVLLDRSRKAQSFAAKKIREEHPGVRIQFEKGDEPFVLLVSHVLSELPEAEVEKLLQLVRSAQAVLWVEAGRKQESRKLSRIRAQIIDRYQVLAPCPHQGPCGMLAPGENENWCHFSAPVPSHVSQSAFWRECAKELGIDLRSLPVSYLFAQARDLPAPSLPDGQARILAGSRRYKGYCRYNACTDQGIIQRDFPKRTSRDVFEALAEPGLTTLIDASLLEKKEKTDEEL